MRRYLIFSFTSSFQSEDAVAGKPGGMREAAFRGTQARDNELDQAQQGSQAAVHAPALARA